MLNRKRLFSALWLTFSMTLLASVLFAPIQASGSVAVSSGPDSLCSSLGLSPVRPMPLLSTGMFTDGLLKMKALPSEDEEQDRTDALDAPRVAFLIPCSFCKVHGRRLVAPRAVLSPFPLRC